MFEMDRSYADGVNLSQYLDSLEGYPQRQAVEDDQVDWAVEVPEYDPPYYVAQSVLDTPLSSPEEIDLVDIELNPHGRTGVQGRGLLYHWGENQAADGVVFRFNDIAKQVEDGYLEVLAIQRKDSGRTALPGGFVDDGEINDVSARREVLEETNLKLPPSPGEKLSQNIFCLDARTTDNAWVTTSGWGWTIPRTISHNIEAGDDAADAFWLPVTEENLARFRPHHRLLIEEFGRIVVRTMRKDMLSS